MSGWKLRVVVISLLTLGGAHPLPADEPPPKKDTGPERAVRQAAQEAEVHGIGLYEPANSGILSKDVTDWPHLIDAIRSRKGVGGRLWDLLPEEARKRAADDKIVAKLGERFPTGDVVALQGRVKSALNDLLDRTDFYTEDAFKGVALTEDLKKSISNRNRHTPYQTACLNRALLASAFPIAITPIPSHFRVVRLQVVAGKDVVLVLSSYNACRWEVETLPAAKVVGVILCGYEPQEVAGVDVPLIYRAYHQPDGKPLKAGQKYYRAWDVKDKSFEVLSAAVKELTGKDFTAFHGEYRPGPGTEPYTVRPGAK